MKRDLDGMFKELVAEGVLTFGCSQKAGGYGIGVTYGETFRKCWSGVESVETYDELEDLYNLRKQYLDSETPWLGRLIWLTKKTGYLPLFWYVDQTEKQTDFRFASLNLPANPSDQYYRDLFNLSEENFAAKYPPKEAV